MICNFFIIASPSEKVFKSPTSVSLTQAIDETLRTKREAGRRERYVKDLACYLKLFARGREDMPVCGIGVDEIKAWFKSRNEKPVTRSGSLGRLSAMFGVCWRRGYIDDNPCRRIDRPTIDRIPPEIWTLRRCAKVLIWTRRNMPDFLAWLSLALLAGVRPEECDRLTWDCINLQRGELRIDAAASKVRARRIVYLTLACRAWLTLAKQIGSPLGMKLSMRVERRRKLMRGLRLTEWPQDVLRHTAASYLLARHQDAGKVAHMLGNSASILNLHYKELVPLEDGKRFCSLLPTPKMFS